MYQGSAIGVLSKEKLEQYETLLERARANVLKQVADMERVGSGSGVFVEPQEVIEDAGDESYTWWDVQGPSRTVAFVPDVVDRSDQDWSRGRVGVEQLDVSELKGDGVGVGPVVEREPYPVMLGVLRHCEMDFKSTPDQPGLCYLQAFRSERWGALGEQFRMWPGLGDLLTARQQDFVEVENLMALQCNLARGQVHVLTGWHGGDCAFADVLAKLPARYLPGWLLPWVQRCGDPRKCPSVVMPETLVGGDGEVVEVCDTSGGTIMSAVSGFDETAFGLPHGFLKPVSALGTVAVGVELQPQDLLRDGRCYLRAFEQKFWTAVYDELDDWPVLEDLLAIPRERFISAEQLVSLRCSVIRGEMHIYGRLDTVDGDCSFLGAIAQLGGLLPDWVAEVLKGFPWEGSACGSRVNANTLVGGQGDVSAGRVKLTLLKGGKGVAKCSHCDRIVPSGVRPDEHAVVCAGWPGRLGAQADPVVVEHMARKALVGDVMHALDVKAVVAAFCVDESRMTIQAQSYLSAVAQRRYLEVVEPKLLEAGRNDHAWATVFEARYEGSFRRNYLRWFLADYVKQPTVKVDGILAMARGHSALLAQMLKDIGA